MSDWIDLDMASSVCGSGTARSVRWSNASDTNDSASAMELSVPVQNVRLGDKVPQDFVVKCEKPRLSRAAYITMAITIVTLLAMICDAPPDLAMLGATIFLLLWPAHSTSAGVSSTLPKVDVVLLGA